MNATRGRIERCGFERLVGTTGPLELARELARGGIRIIDLRETADFDAEHISGAVSLAGGRGRAAGVLRRDAVNVFYGHRSITEDETVAAMRSAALGYSVLLLEGGLAGWKQCGLPVHSNIAARAPLGAEVFA